MKRLLALAAACLLSLSLLGCAPDDQAALTVDGEEVLTVGDLEEQLDVVAESDDFLAAYDARGGGTDTLSTSFVATVLNFKVLSAVLEGELADQGIEVTDDDQSTAEETVTQLLAAGDQQTGAPPMEREAVPDPYFDLLVELYANFIALTGSFDGDQQAAQDRLGELVPAADVEVNERYGTWDPDTLSVTAPEGPVSATTVPAAPIPTG